jgi:hypothetical protein
MAQHAMSEGKYLQEKVSINADERHGAYIPTPAAGGQFV